MKEYFTSSSDLVKQQKKKMHGGKTDLSSWGGTQGFDSKFQDNLPANTPNNDHFLCYDNMNSPNSTPFHPIWGKQYCQQMGGEITRNHDNYENYKNYKKYKLKYKNLLKAR